MVGNKVIKLHIVAFLDAIKLMCVCTVTLSVGCLAMAGELRLNAGVDASIVEQQIKTKDDPKQTINATNIIIKPNASIAYEAKDFDVFLKGTHNQVRRQLENETTTQDFTEYSYSGNYDIVENTLALAASGNRSYFSNSLNSFLVDDFLLNSDSLNKNTSNRASLLLNIRRGKFYGLSATTSYDKIVSELNDNFLPDDSVFKNETYGLILNAISGEGLDGARVSLTSNLQYSKRDLGQDFVTQQVSISSDIEAYGDFGLALNATYENNEIRTEIEVENNGLREFYSVGAGLIWQPRGDRYIEVLLNRSTTSSLLDEDEDEEDTFVSYNVNWAFSARTSIQANFTRRFFGDAGNVSFRHQKKNWRSSINYSEVVSSNSQLLNSNNVGLFICENGSTDITDCRLSDTLQPELTPGETLQSFVVQNLNINDRIIIRKALAAQTAVTRRRTTLSLVASSTQDEEVQFNRIFDVSTVRASLAFSLTHNTTIQYAFNHSKTELDQEGEIDSAITKEHSVQVRRQLTRRLSTSLSLRYLDRNGEVNRGIPSLIGLNGPLTDRRLTFQVSYNLGNKN